MYNCENSLFHVVSLVIIRHYLRKPIIWKRQLYKPLKEHFSSILFPHLFLRLNINSPSQRTIHKFDFFPSECQRLCLTNQSIPLSLTSLPKSLNLQDSLCSCQQNVSRSIHHFVIIPQEERETYPRLKQLPLRHQFLTTLSCLLPRTSPLTTLIKNQVLCSYKKQCWIIYINKFVSLITLLLHFLDETALILIRHGESLWNAKNLFTGCVDVPLTEKGVEEAIEAGKRISNIPIDVIFTSSLIRAQMTAMLAMIQHRRKKVCENQAQLSDLIFSFNNKWI